MREQYKIFETDEQNKKRLEALKLLNEQADSWHLDLSKNVKNIPAKEAESRHSTILSFGSFKMGVHFPQTDMDLICVFPHYIQQEDFFSGFKNVLTGLKETEEILDVVDARIPILKLKFMGF